MNTGMIWQTRSTNSAETERLGELLGRLLKGSEVIELRSDLGGGKTTFVRGLAKGAGSKAHVSSPTFTLSRIYPAKGFEIHHFDFYRLADPGIMAGQLAESINNDKSVVVVEWAQVVRNVLPPDRISLELEPVVDNPDERKVTLSYTDKSTQLIKQLEKAWVQSQP